MIRVRCAVLVLAVAGCVPRIASPPASPHYIIGGAYQAGGVWYYPAESLSYDATGLATVQGARTGLTANGETPDPTALTASHPTLQLPAIVRVTNLQNGRQLLVRVNDRGPDAPTRVIALSKRTAELLNAADGTPVRVQVESEASQAVATALRGGALPGMDAAPLAAIASETLAPLPGTAQSLRVRSGAPAREVADAPPAAAVVPDRLPENVVQGMASPGGMWIWAGEFGRRQYADDVSARLVDLGAQVQRIHQPRQDIYRVRVGPFASVGDADAALGRALAAGASDARIVIDEEGAP